MQAVTIRAPWEGACSSLRGDRKHESLVSTARPCAIRCGLAEPSGKPAPMGEVTRYKDNWFDKAAMALLAGKMQSITGMDYKRPLFPSLSILFGLTQS